MTTILTCPKCNTPLVADAKNPKYALCPKEFCGYNISIADMIAEQDDQHITQHVVE
jgi:uncharacterized protein YbaR (Trm112 family)